MGIGAEPTRRLPAMAPDVHLERWSDADAGLLAALNGDPAQMAHVGGAESAEKIAERQARYVADPHQYVAADADGARTGWVGFWEREWRGTTVYEMGWSILPAFQGRGLAARRAPPGLREGRPAGGGAPVPPPPGGGQGPPHAGGRPLR